MKDGCGAGDDELIGDDAEDDGGVLTTNKSVSRIIRAANDTLIPRLYFFTRIADFGISVFLGTAIVTSLLFFQFLKYQFSKIEIPEHDVLSFDSCLKLCYQAHETSNPIIAICIALEIQLFL